jgi:hypothetical protein
MPSNLDDLDQYVRKYISPAVTDQIFGSGNFSAGSSIRVAADPYIPTNQVYLITRSDASQMLQFSPAVYPLSLPVPPAVPEPPVQPLEFSQRRKLSLA